MAKACKIANLNPRCLCKFSTRFSTVDLCLQKKGSYRYTPLFAPCKKLILNYFREPCLAIGSWCFQPRRTHTMYDPRVDSSNGCTEPHHHQQWMETSCQKPNQVARATERKSSREMDVISCGSILPHFNRENANMYIQYSCKFNAQDTSENAFILGWAILMRFFS